MVIMVFKLSYIRINVFLVSESVLRNCLDKSARLFKNRSPITNPVVVFLSRFSSGTGFVRIVQHFLARDVRIDKVVISECSNQHLRLVEGDFHVGEALLILRQVVQLEEAMDEAERQFWNIGHDKFFYFFESGDGSNR